MDTKVVDESNDLLNIFNSNQHLRPIHGSINKDLLFASDSSIFNELNSKWLEVINSFAELDNLVSITRREN